MTPVLLSAARLAEIRHDALTDRYGHIVELRELLGHIDALETEADGLAGALEKYLPLIEGRIASPHGLSSRDAHAALGVHARRRKNETSESQACA